MSETYVPYSRADYAGDGEIDMFAVPFPFISRDHVALIVNGDPVDFTWMHDGMVKADIPPPTSVENNPANVRVRRLTPATQMLVVFSSPSSFRSEQINAAFTQALYVVQEAFDAAEEGFRLARDLEDALNQVISIRDAIIAIHGEIEGIEADMLEVYQDVLELYDDTVEALSAALDAQNAAESARAAAESAQGSAESARDTAVGAAGTATSAAGTALGAKDDAESAASSASSSAGTAVGAASSASTSAGNAATSESNAAGHASNADAARIGAEAARDAAVVAKDAAEAAAESVEDVISGAGLMAGANNLSDVADPAAAFSNIKQAGTESDTGVFEKATTAETTGGTADKVITADRIVSASAPAALTDAATVALAWGTRAAYTLTITASRILGNPTGGQPGTWRTLVVEADDATERALVFGNQYGGELPDLTDITNTKKYILMIYCKTTTQFLVFAADGSDA